MTELARSDIVAARREALSRKRLMLPAVLWSAPGILWLLFFLAIPSLLLLALAFATRGSYGEILWQPTLKNFKPLAISFWSSTTSSGASSVPFLRQLIGYCLPCSVRE